METSKIMLQGQKQFYDVHKKEDIYLDIAKDVQIKFDDSDYQLDRPLPKGKNKKAIGLM